MITKLVLATFTCSLFCALPGCEPSTAPRDGVMTTERQKGVNTNASSESPAVPRATQMKASAPVAST